MKYKNNPFNIRYNPQNDWLGCSAHTNGFCEFIARDLGVRAALITLRTYIKKGFVTVSGIISRWAPVTDGNNTSDYMMFVSAFLKDGIYTEIKFGSDSFCEMVCRMAWMETHTFLTPKEVKYIILKYKL